MPAAQPGLLDDVCEVQKLIADSADLFVELPSSIRLQAFGAMKFHDVLSLDSLESLLKGGDWNKDAFQERFLSGDQFRSWGCDCIGHADGGSSFQFHHATEFVGAPADLSGHVQDALPLLPRLPAVFPVGFQIQLHHLQDVRVSRRRLFPAFLRGTRCRPNEDLWYALENRFLHVLASHWALYRNML